VCGQPERDALRNVEDPQALVERDALDRFDVSHASQWLVEQSSVSRLRHDGRGAMSFNVACRLRHVPPIVFAWYELMFSSDWLLIPSGAALPCAA